MRPPPVSSASRWACSEVGAPEAKTTTGAQSEVVPRWRPSEHALDAELGGHPAGALAALAGSHDRVVEVRDVLDPSPTRSASSLPNPARTTVTVSDQACVARSSAIAMTTSRADLEVASEGDQPGAQSRGRP